MTIVKGVNIWYKERKNGQDLALFFMFYYFFNQGWNIIKYIEKYHRGTQYIKINTIKNKYPEQNWYSLTRTNKLQRVNQNSWNHVHQMFVKTLDRSLKILHKLAPRVTIWAKGSEHNCFLVAVVNSTLTRPWIS